jgi:hypothetical protein
MRTHHLPSTLPLRTSTGPPWTGFLCALVCLFALIGCNRSQPPQSDNNLIFPHEFEATGEDFLIGALDEVNAIAEWARSNGREALPPRERKLVLSKTATDTVYIYGQVTSGGYGAVVTERHGYPKGLLLITVRRSHGREGGRIVTDTRRYITFESFQNDEPQQSSQTELYGLSSDTIVTRVLRNGVLETYTFRLPVITRVVNPLDGSVRVTSRYGADSSIVSEVKDGTGALIQLRRNSGLATGGLLARTEYADSTWRSILTIGQADGSVFREITSGP